MADDPIRVLFVCLGNICRSPLAEGVFRSLVRAREIESRYLVDSAGTGAWHAGERPDQRSVEVARRNGVVLAGYARQIEAPDFADFDYVIAMDRQNLLELRTLARSPQGEAHLHLLRDFDPEPGDGARVLGSGTAQARPRGRVRDPRAPALAAAALGAWRLRAGNRLRGLG